MKCSKCDITMDSMILRDNIKLFKCPKCLSRFKAIE